MRVEYVGPPVPPTVSVLGAAEKGMQAYLRLNLGLFVAHARISWCRYEHTQNVFVTTSAMLWSGRIVEQVSEIAPITRQEDLERVMHGVVGAFVDTLENSVRAELV